MFHRCTVCGRAIENIMCLDNIPPLQNRFFPSRNDALNYATAKVEFWFCQDCDHIMIEKDIHDEFDPSYDNSDMASLLMVESYEQVVKQIVSHCLDKDKNIVEIGCGRGELLYLLKDLGFTNLKGYDPASLLDNKLISRCYWSYSGGPKVDCFILRHTLEEIPDAKAILKSIVLSLSDNGEVYCEITNVSELKNIDGLFSIYPECYQMFSSLSLSKLFSQVGLTVSEIISIDDGHRLGIWAKKRNNYLNTKVLDGRENLSYLLKNVDGSVVLWGAAGRGGNILSFLKIDLSVVEFVVDINIKKQGQFIPPFGQKVVAPDSLSWIKPKIILLANKKYIREVKEMVPDYCNVFDITGFIDNKGMI